MSGRPGHDPDKISVDLFRRIDAVCLPFEQDWREGRQPRIDEYLGRGL